MRFATNRVQVLAQALCTLALGCAALLGLPTSASAGTILQFGGTPIPPPALPDFVNAAFAGDNATLTTVGRSNPASPVSLPVTITQLGNALLTTNFPPAFETFITPLTSNTPQSDGQKGGFSGKIIISSAPGGAGLNILTATFSGNGILSASGNAGGLSVPDNVTFTTAEPNIVAALGGATTAKGNLSLSFTNIDPFQGVPFTGFTAQNTGLFATSAVIPEPASIVMASLGLLGVVGYGSLRHKSSEA